MNASSCPLRPGRLPAYPRSLITLCNRSKRMLLGLTTMFRVHAAFARTLLESATRSSRQVVPRTHAPRGYGQGARSASHSSPSAARRACKSAVPTQSVGTRLRGAGLLQSLRGGPVACSSLLPDEPVFSPRRSIGKASATQRRLTTLYAGIRSPPQSGPRTYSCVDTAMATRVYYEFRNIARPIERSLLWLRAAQGWHLTS